MSNKANKIGTAWLFIILGVLLLIIAFWWESSAENHIFLEKILITLLAHFGIGALVIGILSILIETSHWIEYFKDRLMEIVVQPKYLEKLSPEELTTLQTESLKAYFKDNSIAGKNGFLQYYQRNIQKFVASPYRTNIQSDIRIEYSNSDNDKIMVHEEMSWECRATGGKIQDTVQWEPNAFEFEKVEDLQLIIEHPLISTGTIYFGKRELEEKFKTNNDGFIFPLREYITLDGLRIKIISDVIVSKNKFLAWRMAHPSRGISLSVRYPQDLNINKELFGIGEDCFEINDKGKGYYKLSSQKWILPDEGIVFELLG
jgi:hypothetical protein